MSRPLPFEAPVLSVSELNKRVRALLENQFETLWVAGELSNVKRAPSGHWYFCLKDPSAQVECAMFRSRAQFLDFRPENGQQVEVRARVTLYEARGDYQLVVEEVRKAGLGALFGAFEKLKARLQDEGLFDSARKRPLPAFPRAIGIVTSPQAAALRDVLTTLRRRACMTPVVIYPAPVQGEGAALQIARAIETANARGECEVLIVCRGGGSLEDLWPFNEEAVARAIAASRLPVVSGVGHETDFSIADFAADVRAPTPTAAAVAASADREALCIQVAQVKRRIARDMRRLIEARAQALDVAARRLLTPAERLARARERVVELARCLGRDMRRLVQSRRGEVQAAARRIAPPDISGAQRDVARARAALAAALQRGLTQRSRELGAVRTALSHLDPRQVLGRGYSIVRDASGHVRDSSDGLASGDALDITFARGGAQVKVTGPR